MFSLKKVKISQQEKKEKVENMLRRFHLETEKEKSPFVLSQGQKRRLSVASMLLTDQQICSWMNQHMDRIMRTGWN